MRPCWCCTLQTRSDTLNNVLGSREICDRCLQECFGEWTYQEFSLWMRNDPMPQCSFACTDQQLEDYLKECREFDEHRRKLGAETAEFGRED